MKKETLTHIIATLYCFMAIVFVVCAFTYIGVFIVAPLVETIAK